MAFEDVIQAKLGGTAGDEIRAFSTAPESRQALHGRAGYAVARDKEIVDGILVVWN